jgi:hypothetical protein
MQFFFGLTWQNRKNLELDLNPTKLMFNTLIEFVAYCMDQEGSACGLTLALCMIAETNPNPNPNPNLWELNKTWK